MQFSTAGRGVGLIENVVLVVGFGRDRVEPPGTTIPASIFRLGLQMDYELDVETDRLGKRLDREVGQYRKAG